MYLKYNLALYHLVLSAVFGQVASVSRISLAVLNFYSIFPELVQRAYWSAELAAKEINDAGWFPGVSFEVDSFDTGIFDKGQIVNTTMMVVNHGYNGVIGERFSDYSKMVSYTLSKTGIFQCSPYSTSPDLSDKGQFPTFFRLVVDDNYQALVMLQFIKSQNWKNIGILAGPSSYAQKLLDKLQATAFSYGVTILDTQSFDLSDKEALKYRLNALKQAGARIIVTLTADELETVQIFRELKANYMIGPEYVFIGSDTMTGLYGAKTFDPAVDLPNVKALFVTEVLQKSPQYSVNFIEKYKDTYGFEPGNGAVRNYDAVYAFAYAFKSIMTKYHLSPDDIAANTWLDLNLNVTQFLDFTFTGAMGPILWLPNGDIESADFHVLQPGASDFVEIAVASSTEIHFSRAPTFFTGTDVPPADLPELADDLLGYSKPGVAVVIALASIMATVSGASVPLMLVYRTHRNLKPISPLSMSLASMGLLLCVVTIYIDAKRIPTTASCNSYMAVMAIGFGTTVGCILVKLHRLYKIFDNRIAQRKALSNSTLLRNTTIILAGELLLLLVWAARFPLIPVDHRDLSEGRHYYVCQTENSIAAKGMFGAVLAYNAGLVIVCCYLAFMTRNIYSTFNEAKAIGFTIYNIFVCSVLVLLVAYIASMNNVTAFIVRSSIVLLCVAISYGAMIGRFLYAALVSHDTTDKRFESETGRKQATPVTSGKSPFNVTTLAVRGKSPITTSQWKNLSVYIASQPLPVLIVVSKEGKGHGLSLPLHVISVTRDDDRVTVTWNQGFLELQCESKTHAAEWGTALTDGDSTASIVGRKATGILEEKPKDYAVA